MGKQGKIQASSWYDDRSKPLDPEVIKLAIDDARLIEYFVPTDTLGVVQGTALLQGTCRRTSVPRRRRASG